MLLGIIGIYTMLGYLLFFTVVMYAKGKKERATGRHYYVRDILFDIDTEPLDYYEVKMSNNRAIKGFIYFIQDFKAFIYNIYLTVTFKKETKVIYRQVIVTKVKKQVEVAEVKKVRSRNRIKYKDKDVVGQGKVIVNGKELTRKTVRIKNK